VLRLRETTCYNLIADDAVTAESLQLPLDTPADLDFYLIAFYDAMSFFFRALYKVLESQRLILEDGVQSIAPGSLLLSPGVSGPLFARIQHVVLDQLLKLFQADEPRNLPEKVPVSDSLRRRLEVCGWAFCEKIMPKWARNETEKRNTYATFLCLQQYTLSHPLTAARKRCTTQDSACPCARASTLSIPLSHAPWPLC
jgi:hypothetical protein